MSYKSTELENQHLAPSLMIGGSTAAAAKSSRVVAVDFMIATIGVRIVIVIEFIIITSFIELKMANFRSNLI